MDAKAYDQWYSTNRGHWIGSCELELLIAGLGLQPGESVLDVGCGTGYFTRALGRIHDGKITGVDIDAQRIEYAQKQDPGRARYQLGDATALAFPDAAFDVVISMTALCFIEHEAQAVREMVRVARRRVAVGLLNRTSLLYLQKGLCGGRGGYRGAKWHTACGVSSLFCGLPVGSTNVRTALFLTTPGKIARALESTLPGSLPLGAFLLVTADILNGCDSDDPNRLGAADWNR